MLWKSVESRKIHGRQDNGRGYNNDYTKVNKFVTGKLQRLEEQSWAN